MSPNTSNGKTYTEVLIEVYEKMDTVEQRIVGKVDAVIRDNADFKADLAKGEAKFEAMDKSCVAISKRIDENASSITKVRNINTFIAVVGSSIAGFLGMRQ